ncbi:hypothetical protein OH738_40735 (plasmid) [Streptomyces hirsutus]|uniref:hypothetical protein n=1 Tax=Streptomyces hirsutus TaxID=35620 RepID=UPI003867F4C7|nr:hypothetical protein OH738_40735 [Streptomyces hirsutus]
MRVPRDLQREHRRHQLVGLSLEGRAVRRGILPCLRLPDALAVLPSAEEQQRDGTDGTGRRVE